MGKLVAVALVVAALGLAPARADDKAAAPAPGDSTAPPSAAPAQKRNAPAKTAKAGKGAHGGKPAKPAKGKDAAAAKGEGAAPEAKPCEPVKPCPID